VFLYILKSDTFSLQTPGCQCPGAEISVPAKKSGTGPAVYSNWSVATPWTPEIRYRPKGSVSEDEAEEMLDAVRDKPDGC